MDHSGPLAGPDGDAAAAALAARWKQTIVGLVREVVSSVDPNVRKGDGLDIRPYVKLKIIPGGGMDECVYVDGVVFRKTVSHKVAGSHHNTAPRTPHLAPRTPHPACT